MKIRSYAIAFCILIFGSVFALISQKERGISQSLSLEMRSSVNAHVQVFFDLGEGYTEENSATLPISSAKDYQEFVFPLPSVSETVYTIRIDPFNRPGSFSLRNLKIVNAEGQLIRSIPVTSVSSLLQVIPVNIKNDVYEAKTTEDAIDPMLLVNLKEPIIPINENFTDLARQIFAGLFILSACYGIWLWATTNKLLHSLITTNFPKTHARKKIFYSIAPLVVIIVATEVGLHLLYGVLKREIFPFGTYNSNINQVAFSGEEKSGNQSNSDEMVWSGNIVEVIHPYLGFVRDPLRMDNISQLGLSPDEDDPLAPKANGSINVAILGGSVAEGTSKAGEAIMKKVLRDFGIDANIITLAMGGYKQPQQLFTLAYLQSHGAQLDVVVNIDGFNEVALPEAENLPKGVNPFYPRAWYTRMLNANDQNTLRQIGLVYALHDDRKQWAKAFQFIPKYSIMRNLLWQAYDSSLEREIQEINDHIRQSKDLAENRYMITGPPFSYASSTELYQQIADHWKSCSLQMKALCDAQDIIYIHLLQPNQYFEAGRDLTEVERKIAFRVDHPYRKGVVEGYPKLLAGKAHLLSQGVNFHDLTMIYHDYPQQIYFDDCCHPDQFGYEVIAKYASHEIVKAMNSKITEIE